MVWEHHNHDSWKRRRPCWPCWHACWPRSSRRSRCNDDRNPRYAADENYDEYRAGREERHERPRRRVRRDFDPFDD
ncbi:MAG: hypothetical protein ACLT4Y_05560 [Bifidobacterium breve]